MQLIAEYTLLFYKDNHSPNKDNIIILEQLSNKISQNKDSFIKEVAGAGYLSSINQKDRNAATYAPLTSHPHAKFCKHTMRIILGIGKRRYVTIIKNYGSIVKSKHGNIGKKYNKSNVQTLKQDYKQHIEEIDDEVEEAHATLFI